MRAFPPDAGVSSSRSIGQFFTSQVHRLVPMMGTSLLFYALTWAPLFTLAATRGPRNVAFYTVAARLAAFITLVPSIQVSYLAPAFARLYHQNELIALNALCSRSAWQASIAAAAPALVFVAVPNTAISALYGGGFEVAAIPLVLLAIGAFIGVVVGQVNQLMLLCQMETSALALNAAWLIAWITLGLWLSALGGAPEAAAFALASGTLYSIVASGLLASTRGIHSFVQLPVLPATSRG
jgi:O-antigen/teichoic acid export membrane protein